jgi:hypothetical protein
MNTRNACRTAMTNGYEADGVERLFIRKISNHFGTMSSVKGEIRGPQPKRAAERIRLRNIPREVEQ